MECKTYGKKNRISILVDYLKTVFKVRKGFVKIPEVPDLSGLDTHIEEE